MPTEWAVDAAAAQFSLDPANRGELTFTVTNPGPATDTAVFDVVPGDGAQRTWFTVDEPQRRVPSGNGTVSFLVHVLVPVGTPAGRYDMTGRAYSLNTAPEETARSSGRVTFEVKPVKPHFPWIPVLIGAVILAIVLAAVGYLLFKPSGGTPVARPSTTPSAVPSPSPTGIAVFTGTWTNVDAATRNLVRAVITPSTVTASTLHLFAACSPSPCDWGTTAAALSNPAPPQLSATYNQGFVIRTITISRSGDQLVVKTHSHYIDNSGRPDRDDTDTMAPVPPVLKAPPPILKTP